ncbi:MAG: polyprenyl synthetase family protein, partial [Paracoccaceae bacterium]|nr:polyprenyl synthetase family protein [Paracoccaceae bacterium]
MVHILENLGNYGLAARIEAAMNRAVSVGASDKAPTKLKRALEYATFPGGARIRPTILTSVALACGDDKPQLTDAAAAALELIHCGSLVHDDLPCFD